MKKDKLRPLGEIMLDLEPFILEMADHNLQWGDFHGLLHQYMEIHLPNHQEEYMDGTNPIYFYGPKEKLKKRFDK